MARRADGLYLQGESDDASVGVGHVEVMAFEDEATDASPREQLDAATTLQ
jgi:hypothetical protein